MRFQFPFHVDFSERELTVDTCKFNRAIIGVALWCVPLRDCWEESHNRRQHLCTALTVHGRQMVPLCEFGKHVSFPFDNIPAIPARRLSFLLCKLTARQRYTFLILVTEGGNKSKYSHTRDEWDFSRGGAGPQPIVFFSFYFNIFHTFTRGSCGDRQVWAFTPLDVTGSHWKCQVYSQSRSVCQSDWLPCARTHTSHTNNWLIPRQCVPFGGGRETMRVHTVWICSEN